MRFLPKSIFLSNRVFMYIEVPPLHRHELFLQA